MRVRLIHAYLSALSPLPPSSSSRLSSSFLSLSVGPSAMLPAACPGFVLADLLGLVSPSSGYIRVSLRLGSVGLPTMVCSMEVHVLRTLGRRTRSSAILGLLSTRRHARRTLACGVEEVGRETLDAPAERKEDITSTLELTGEEGDDATAAIEITEEEEEKKEQEGAELDVGVIISPGAMPQVRALCIMRYTSYLMP